MEHKHLTDRNEVPERLGHDMQEEREGGQIGDQEDIEVDVRQRGGSSGVGGIGNWEGGVGIRNLATTGGNKRR